jgi:hypothetical protein
MKMGARPGYLVYSGQGGKKSSFESLPQVLKDEIEKRPEFRHAPTEVTAPNESSWTYFKKHFDEFK